MKKDNSQFFQFDSSVQQELSIVENENFDLNDNLVDSSLNFASIPKLSSPR